MSTTQIQVCVQKSGIQKWRFREQIQKCRFREQISMIWISTRSLVFLTMSSLKSFVQSAATQRFKVSTERHVKLHVNFTALELEWTRAYHAKASEADPVNGKMYNDLMADLMNNIKLGKSSEFVTRVCKAMASSRHPNQPDIIVLLMWWVQLLKNLFEYFKK